MPRPVDGSGNPIYPEWSSIETTETVTVNGVLRTESNIVDPPTSLKQQGIRYNTNLPYQYVNWKFRLDHQWIQYFDEELQNQLTEPSADNLYLRQDQNLADLDSAPAARTFLDVLSSAEINTLISNAVDALINGSPGALDTLNELAAALGDDANFAATVTALINEKMDQTVLVGAIFPIGMATATTGTLLCQGQAVNRTTYARLFSAIGTTYGVGNGSTTFNLPDLRGEFIRGLDAGRGVDAGRALGSFQADAFEAHDHTNGESAWSSTSDEPSTVGPDYDPGDPDGRVLNFNDGGGANETRPRNIALNYVIVY